MKIRLGLQDSSSIATTLELVESLHRPARVPSRLRMASECVLEHLKGHSGLYGSLRRIDEDNSAAVLAVVDNRDFSGGSSRGAIAVGRLLEGLLGGTNPRGESFPEMRLRATLEMDDGSQRRWLLAVQAPTPSKDLHGLSPRVVQALLGDRADVVVRQHGFVRSPPAYQDLEWLAWVDVAQDRIGEFLCGGWNPSFGGAQLGDRVLLAERLRVGQGTVLVRLVVKHGHVADLRRYLEAM